MQASFKLIILVSLFSLSSQALAETVYCADKEVGSEFQHNGHTYLVVDNKMIQDSEKKDTLTEGSLRFCTSHVTDMSNAVAFIDSFNQPIDDWDVSNVTNMKAMFMNATAFNQPLNNWDVSNVTDMTLMFSSASSFNQPIDNWDVSKVTNMGAMFASANAFNQPLNNWKVSNATDMHRMFSGAKAFKQSLDSWAKKPELPNQ